MGLNSIAVTPLLAHFGVLCSLKSILVINILGFEKRSCSPVKRDAHFKKKTGLRVELSSQKPLFSNFYVVSPKINLCGVHCENRSKG